MKTINRILSRIYQDLAQGKNIESYVISVMAMLLAMLGVLEDIVSEKVMLAAMLAALSLLVFNLTVPKEGYLDLDSVLRNRSHFKVTFQERIRDAKKLWIYGPSADSLFNSDTPAFMKTRILDQGGEVRVMVQDPDETTAVDILEKQLDGATTYSIQDLRPALQNTLHKLEKMISWDYSGNLEYRLLPFSPGFSLVIIDPHKATGVIIVEFHGFGNVQITNRMHIEITRDQSAYWFDYWIEQFEGMWKYARIPNPSSE